MRDKFVLYYSIIKNENNVKKNTLKNDKIFRNVKRCDVSFGYQEDSKWLFINKNFSYAILPYSYMIINIYKIIIIIIS